eukprot:gene10732-2822_t
MSLCIRSLVLYNCATSTVISSSDACVEVSKRNCGSSPFFKWAPFTEFTQSESKQERKKESVCVCVAAVSWQLLASRIIYTAGSPQHVCYPL